MRVIPVALYHPLDAGGPQVEVVKGVVALVSGPCEEEPRIEEVGGGGQTLAELVIGDTVVFLGLPDRRPGGDEPAEGDLIALYGLLQLKQHLFFRVFNLLPGGFSEITHPGDIVLP